MISEMTAKLLSISMLNGVGPATLRKVSALPGFREFDREIEKLAQELPVLHRAVAPAGAWDTAQALAEKQIEEAKRFCAHIISPLDTEYPALLAASADDPFLLYVRGALSKTPSQSVAIIGTREPTRAGSITTDRISRYFVEQEWSVVSGLALGCDSRAHHSVLEAGGHTVAVLAHGLQMTAPASHRELAEQIVESGGALVSQYPFGRKAIPQQFAQRNRTQAGLSQGVVMIQSDLTGGSLIASRAALRYGRWLAVPRPSNSDLSTDESKIQANQVLVEGTPEAQSELLKLQDDSALARIIVLRDKQDLPRCLESVKEVDSSDMALVQGSFL